MMDVFQDGLLTTPLLALSETSAVWCLLPTQIQMQGMLLGTLMENAQTCGTGIRRFSQLGLPRAEQKLVNN